MANEIKNTETTEVTETPETVEPKEAPKVEKKPEKTISKVAFDKVAAELAELKRKERERMTEEEQKEADRLALEAKVQELEQREKTRLIEVSFVRLGMDDKQANAIAIAILEGDVPAMEAEFKSFIEGVKSSIKSELLDNTPVPERVVGDTDNPPLVDLSKMTYKEAQEYFAKNPGQLKAE